MSSTHSLDTVRRPVAARRTRWATDLTRALLALGARPNQVSIASLGWAAIAAAALIAGAHGPPLVQAVTLLIAAGSIQVRLLCNMLDGMLAVEGGLQTRSGTIFNELPDRASDAAILIAAGYAVIDVPWAPELGWGAALLAVLTAYVRTLGRSAGAREDFSGPMAKQQRMMTLTAACLLGAILAGTGWSERVILLALTVIAAGCAVTIVRRTIHVLRELETL
jgi:phosphatidylglycerophosphate synthase